MTDLQVQSVVDYLGAGAKNPKEFRFGLEIEHLLVNIDTGRAVTYAGEKGVEKILEEIVAQTEEHIEASYRESGHLLGVKGTDIDISLEPGAQFECAMGPFFTSEDFLKRYNKIRATIDPILKMFNCELQTFGYHLVTKRDEIQIIPKARYTVMNEYLGKTGKYGRNMMRCSASTQVSIDYSSEVDAIQKTRVGFALGPLFAFFFKNTPVFEGEKNTVELIRLKMWDDCDPYRCSTVPGLYDADFSFAKYAKYILSVPLMVADFHYTPEKDHLLENEKVVIAYDSASDMYPDRRLNKQEIEHIISTYFFDVRLKNFVELRTVDSLPIERALEFLDMVRNVFYNQKKLDEVSNMLEGIDETDIVAAKAQINSLGEDAIVYGVPLKQWGAVLTPN
ncbi:glutamate--cysteine ligase [Actinomycetota bacterium]|nr:glutamate--cysteine ligase [Actinomycetota bacterium]